MTALAALPVVVVADGDHHWWPIWPILWLAVIGALVWWVVKRRGRRHDPLDRAREILAERYATGELTGEEYRARLDDLRPQR
jgi:putative membrane protein